MTSTPLCEDISPGDIARSIIAERWPSLAQHLASAQPFTDLELDTSGPVPTLTANGIRLASAWDPDAECALQIAHLPRSVDAITLYGVGMGGLPERLLKHLSPSGTLSVVLLNCSLFNTMLDVIEQSEWLQHPAVRLELPSKPAVIAPLWVITTPLLTLAEASAEQLRDHLYQALSDNMSAQHLAKKEAIVLANMDANEVAARQDSDVSELLAENCNAALIVGAGPSLDLSLNRVSELQATGVRVICVDAALQSLMKAEIIPDCIVTLDPLHNVLRFFEVNIERLKQTSLVYFPHVHPHVVRNWPHRRYVAYANHPRYQSLRARKSHTNLFSSGSVIHPATDLAVRMGATTLYLAGADFGFPFGATHSKASAFCKPAPAASAFGLTVTSYAGEAIPTQMNFLSYYRDLEAYIGSGICKGRHFVNLGEFSARIAGASHEVLT